jgi:hypothetical protein
MARAASNRAQLAAALLGLALLACPAPPARADFESEERERAARRADEDVWQAVFGQQVVAGARRELGKPYRWGGKTGEDGFDCSGYTAFVYGGMGIRLAPTALLQFQQGVEVERSGLLPGDLVFFLGRGSPLHVGIYEGEGRFLHAPGTGKVIGSSSLDEPYFLQRYVGARRLCPALDEERRRRAAPAALPGPEGTSTPTPTSNQETQP